MSELKETAVLSVLGLDTDVENLSASDLYKNLRRVKAMQEILKAYHERLRVAAFRKAEEIGEQDDKGSYFVKLPDGNWFKKEARTSVKVDKDKAVELFKEKGLENRLTRDISVLTPKDVIKYLPGHVIEELPYDVLDEDIHEAYYAGELSDDELQAIVKRKITYALATNKN